MYWHRCTTHAFGGSKMRVGNKLQQAGGPPLPLVAAMRGVENKLPLWACDDGCDFIRGTRLLNVTLQSLDIALSSVALYMAFCPCGELSSLRCSCRTCLVVPNTKFSWLTFLTASPSSAILPMFCSRESPVYPPLY